MTLAHTIKQRVLYLGYREVPLQRRGIICDPAIKPQLELALRRFLDGYHLALASTTTADLARRLDAEIEPNFQGFAYEGAAMFLAIMDYLTPWQPSRVDAFLAEHGADHDYLISVGIGFAIARIPWARRSPLRYALRYPPGLAGLVLDGYGFHEGFFHSARTIRRGERPRGITGYAARCFDAGIGRSLWFVCGADPERLRDTIRRFDAARQPDLWAGVGLACTYAGSAYQDLAQYETILRRLVAHAGPHTPQLAFGVACAAGARIKAGNATAWTARACETILDLPAAEAGALVNDSWAAANAEVAGRPRGAVGLRVHQTVNERIIARLARRARIVSVAA